MGTIKYEITFELKSIFSISLNQIFSKQNHFLFESGECLKIRLIKGVYDVINQGKFEIFFQKTTNF